MDEEQVLNIHYTNHNGVLGHMFVIGIGEESFAFTIDKNVFKMFKTLVETNEDGQEINRAIFDMDGQLFSDPIPIDQVGPIDPRKVITMADLIEYFKSEKIALHDYVTELMNDIIGSGGVGGGSGSGSTGGGDPSSTLLPFRPMLEPSMFTVDMLVPKYTLLLGTLTAQSFIDRIVLETHSKFILLDESEDEWQFSIGLADPAEAEFLIPRTPITELNKRKAWVVDIQHTFPDPTAFALYIYHITKEDPNPDPGEVKPEEPPDPDGDFVQTVYLSHANTTYSLTSDNSKKVWNVTIQGDDVFPAFNHPELFGDIGKMKLIDVGVNIPMKPGHRYRVDQYNPALQFFAHDNRVENADGLWIKSAEYDWTDKPEDEECEYYLCLMPSTGETDYVHLYLYDLDGDTPSLVTRTYHIRNLINFRPSEEEEEPEPGPSEPEEFTQMVQVSTPDITAKIESDDGATCNMTIGGLTTGANISHPELFGDVGGEKAIDVVINLPVEKGDRVIVVQINKALQHFAHDPSVTDGDTGGVLWTKSKTYTHEEDGPFEYAFVLTESEGDSDIVHIAVYKDGEGVLEPYRTYIIANDVQFTPDEAKQSLRRQLYPIMPLAEGDGTSGPTTSTGEDEGAIRIRILSF